MMKIPRLLIMVKVSQAARDLQGLAQCNKGWGFSPHYLLE
jgi:hypothetical protein